MSEAKCWLSELFKYQATEGKTPLENFQTTIFAWVLCEREQIRERVLTKLFNGLKIRGDVRITTQYTSLSGCRPDMRLESDDFIAYVENKVDSQFRKEQLTRYKTDIRAERVGPNMRLVGYIGRTAPSPSDLEGCGVLTWSDVYSIIAAESDLENNTLLKAVTRFMEENGMDNKCIEGNPSEVINMGRKFRNFRERCRSITGSFIGEIKARKDEFGHLGLTFDGSFEGLGDSNYYGQWISGDGIGPQIFVGLAWPDRGPDEGKLVLVVEVKAGGHYAEHWDRQIRTLGNNWKTKWLGWAGPTCVIDI